MIVSNSPQWNREQFTAVFPQYRHPLDHSADYDPLADRTVSVSRETWHNAKAALEMMEHRQTLTVQEHLWNFGQTITEAIRSAMFDSLAHRLRYEAQERGLMVFGAITESVHPGRFEGDELLRVQAVGLKPFEWKGLY